MAAAAMVFFRAPGVVPRVPNLAVPPTDWLSAGWFMLSREKTLEPVCRLMAWAAAWLGSVRKKGHEASFGMPGLLLAREAREEDETRVSGRTDMFSMLLRRSLE